MLIPSGSSRPEYPVLLLSSSCLGGRTRAAAAALAIQRHGEGGLLSAADLLEKAPLVAGHLDLTIWPALLVPAKFSNTPNTRMPPPRCAWATRPIHACHPERLPLVLGVEGAEGVCSNASKCKLPPTHNHHHHHHHHRRRRRRHHHHHLPLQLLLEVFNVACPSAVVQHLEEHRPRLR